MARSNLISHKTVEEFWKPWPIVLKKGSRFRLRFVRLSRARKYMAYWCGGIYTIEDCYYRIKKRDWMGKRHQIESAARHYSFDQPTVIVNKYGIVIDGNHRLLALIQKKYKGLIMILEQT